LSKNILLTGSPGVGKTTVIERLIERLCDLKPIGFYTREIRGEGNRVGFSLISLDGTESVLSHIGLVSPYRVGRYKVDVEGFEKFLNHLDLLNSPSSIAIIDEIGKMECFSQKFQKIVIQLLEGEKTLVATIAIKGRGFPAKIRKRKDCDLIQLTKENRDLLPKTLEEMVKKLR